jgi:hypothetical protein
MAKKGFWQGGKEIVQELDRLAGSVALVGPTLAAERIVREVQQAGPSWTGKFSNSWQIEGPQGQSVKGDGQPGEPRPVEFTATPFTGRQATATLFRTGFLKEKVVFRISNFSPYAAEATDEVQSTFERPKNAPIPQTQLGLKKWDEQDTTRLRNTYRGQTTGGRPGGSASRTASLDWLATYADGGALNKAVKIEMDAALRNPR